MSKNFPAIRYHGNAEAGVRHTKRGMYELFVAQDLQKRMGVPIYKRTVEVNEYTTITVQIAMEQTFVHIYSNPPSLPEVVLPPPEREVPEPYGCPSAFIIRSQLDKGSAEQKHNGYVIAYNHLTSRWSVATFRDKYGNTVPEAANLGWYHAKDTANTGVYSHCDVVTWKGQSGPSFQSVSSAVSGSSPNIFIDSKFYFQGRKFDAPGDVLGACILQDNDGIDYVHVHAGLITPITGDNFHKCSHSFHRKKLSSVLAGTGNWESLGGLKSTTPPDFFPGFTYYLAPRSTDYIDENGYAHFITEHTGYDETYVHKIRPGKTRYLKVNMRDGSAEVLNSSDISAPIREASASFTDDIPGPYGWYAGAANYSSENLENPWIFYVYPGTQDLYTLGLELNCAHAGSLYAIPVNFKHQSVTDGLNCSGEATATMITYKNGASIDRWVLSYDYYSYKEEVVPRPSGSPDYAGVTSGYSGACDTKCTWLLEYHPEMPKNTTYMEYTNNAEGYNEVNYYRDGVKTNLGREYYSPVVIRYLFYYVDSEPIPYPVPATFYGYGITPFWTKIDAERIAGTHPTLYQQGEKARLGDVCFNDGPEYGPMIFELWEIFKGGLITIGGVGAERGEPLAGYSIKIGSGSIGYGFKYFQLENWGSVYDFYVKLRVFATPSAGTYMADAYAIHRPVGDSGEKPYLHLRKDLKTSEASFYEFTEGHTRVLESFNEDSRVIMADEDPALFGPGINNYGESLGINNRRQRQLWAGPSGALQDTDADPDNETTHWEDKNWELLSNFTSADLLNAMTKEIGNAFFNIGIM